MVKEVANSLPDVIAIETSVSTPQGYQRAVSHGISGVPTILINDKVAFVGVPPSINALKQMVLSVIKA
jgi:protein-disulfide isomerase